MMRAELLQGPLSLVRHLSPVVHSHKVIPATHTKLIGVHWVDKDRVQSHFAHFFFDGHKSKRTIKEKRQPLEYEAFRTQLLPTYLLVAFGGLYYIPQNYLESYA